VDGAPGRRARAGARAPRRVVRRSVPELRRVQRRRLRQLHRQGDRPRGPAARGARQAAAVREEPRQGAAARAGQAGAGGGLGDGVYEVFRATEGELFAADRHLRRLARGLAVLELARPAALTDAALLAAARRVLDDNALTRGDALVYLQITRGAAGPRAHQFPPAGTPPTVYLAANAFTPPDDVRARGASVVTTPDERWGRCDIKSI